MKNSECYCRDPLFDLLMTLLYFHFFLCLIGDLNGQLLYVIHVKILYSKVNL